MATFWTIQHIDKWREFEAFGVLQADTDFIPSYFTIAYDWVREQMHKRISNSPNRDVYPIWAWYKYKTDYYRPDLRRSGHLAKGTPGVLVQYEEKMENVLLTDFIAWHMVLNTPKPTSNDYIKWQKIVIEENEKRRIAESIVQASLWNLSIDKVKSVKYFVAK
jgi:hypothetical protein